MINVCKELYNNRILHLNETKNVLSLKELTFCFYIIVMKVFKNYVIIIQNKNIVKLKNRTMICLKQYDWMRGTNK